MGEGRVQTTNPSMTGRRKPKCVRKSVDRKVVRVQFPPPGLELFWHKIMAEGLDLTTGDVTAKWEQLWYFPLPSIATRPERATVKG